MKSLSLFFLFVSACSDQSGNNNLSPTNNGSTPTTHNGTLSHNGSTPNNTTPSLDYAQLIINEIAASGDPQDWFEIYNPSDQTIDMTGVGYTDDLNDIRKALLKKSIGPKSYLKIEVSIDSAGFKLGRAEELGLFAPDGTQIDSVDWADGNSPSQKSFGRIPDVSGPFKTLNTPTPGAANIDNNPNDPICGDMTQEGAEVCDGSQFAGKTCQDKGFSSGALTCAPDCLSISTKNCIAAINDIVINELRSSGDDNIELYNSSDTSVDLSNWYIVDEGYMSVADVAHRYDLPTGTTLAAKAFLVLTKGVEHTFGIGGTDALTLYDLDDKIIDHVTWPDGDASLSWCRMTDGDGAFQTCTMPSFGSSNTP